MKTIENISYFIGGENADASKIVLSDPGTGSIKLSTVELCKQAINNVPQGGLSPAMMYDRLQVLNVLETQKDETCITFEDSQMKTLQDCVAELKFVSLQAAFLDFTDKIKNAK